MRIDLDAARAARREVAREPISIVLDGAEYHLPPELPFQVAEAMSEMAGADGAEVGVALAKVVQAFLGEGYGAFMASQPSIEDLNVLVENLAKAYGFGESNGSEPGS